jgi:hypothetical protein
MPEDYKELESQHEGLFYQGRNLIFGIIQFCEAGIKRYVYDLPPRINIG